MFYNTQIFEVDGLEWTVCLALKNGIDTWCVEMYTKKYGCLCVKIGTLSMEGMYIIILNKEHMDVSYKNSITILTNRGSSMNT